ncbi:MAG: hypothetical protein CMC55_00900 [Flavobacteriaceae bacterium]|nr:hypothetical protein [Flavobacteriaceae bacterium]
MAKEIIEAEIKSNIGEVADGIDKAAKNTEKLDKATKKGTKGFKGLGTAVKGVGMALKAAGIGLVVALLAKLMEVFKSNQKVVDFFNVAMESLSIAFNDLFGFLEKNVGKVTGWFKDIFENPQQSIKDFGTAIKENLLERFDSLLETFGHLGKALGHLFKGEFAEAWGSVKDAGKESIDIMTGVDDSVDKITTTITNAAGAIKDYAKETYKSAKATIELNKAAELAAVQVQGLIEEYDRQAEKLRQVRDDETKTFAERIEANEKLGKVLEEQGVEMQKLVDIQVNAAQVEYNKNKNQENLIALTQALNERKAVEAQITGFQSEQLTNQVALEKELGETKRELMLSGLEGMALELAELQTAYDLKIEMARKAGEDTTAITEKFEKDQAEIKKKYEKQKQKWSEMSAEAQLDIMSQTAGNMVKILGEETAAGKAMAVTQATIDTYKGATAAYSAMAGIPYVGPVLGAIAAGAAVASGLANVKAILSADASGGGGGGDGAPSTGGASAQAPAPEMLSGKFELGGGVEPEPLKAFVVTDEMTNSQDQLANIRRRATV